MKVFASLLPLLALALQGVSAAPTEPINVPVEMFVCLHLSLPFPETDPF